MQDHELFGLALGLVKPWYVEKVTLDVGHRELGLMIPDPELRFDEAAGEWRYTEPDWNELRTVVTNHGPMSEARLEFRRLAREETRWVRESILGVPAAA